jgi:hypothetical protein
MALSRATRHRGVLWPAAALLPPALLLTACSDTDGATAAAGGRAGASSPSASTAATAGASAPEDLPTASYPSVTGGNRPDRCRTSKLVVTVGPGEAGAGQRAFSVGLINQSDRSCTVRGYPGAAFVDASGARLGPDPRRTDDTPVTTVKLSPGQGTWATLSYSDARLTGSRAGTPAKLLIYPPDEREPLSVLWDNGKVPVSEDAAISVTAFGKG